MEVKATHRNARMSARKIKPVGMVVRGLSVHDADAQLAFTPGKAAVIVRKVLNSAVANAVNNFDMKRDSLTVVNVMANAGLTFKRFNPVAKGMAHPILKRNAHVTVIVGGAEGLKKKARQTEIETVSADKLLEEPVEAPAEAVKDVKKETSTVAAKAKEERSQDTKTDKATGKAYQTKKMLQMGGDAKKTHRRESK